jgi:hypothetical protein
MSHGEWLCVRMTKSMKQLFLIAFSLLVVLASCKKDKAGPEPGPGPDPDTIPGKINYKGMGNSTEDPEGTPFSLPEGIVLEKMRFSDTCYEQNWRNRSGIGRGVYFCMTLTNTTNQPRPVRLPPYIIFISKTVKVQNGILLFPYEYMVPARLTVTFLVEAFCLNKQRDPARWGDEFKLGPVSDNAELKKVAAALAGKEQVLQITGFEDNASFAKKVNDQTTVCKAIWEITEGSGKLTEEHRQALIGIK